MRKRRSNRKPRRSLQPESLESRQLMTADCIDFEDLTLGKEFVHGDSFVADDTGFQAEITLEEFEWTSGGTTTAGFARVENGGLAGGNGQDLQVNNTLLRFDLSEPVPGLTLKYGEYGGNLNFEINGSSLVFEDFTDIGFATPVPSLGGVDIFINDDPTSELGEIQLVGNIEQFKIGGQELWIDEVCLTENDREPIFDFGDAPDSYGTTRANFGPAHLVVPKVHLGRTVDPELDGQPSADAQRDDMVGFADDEDGVNFTSAIVAGSTADVEVTASTRGWLNAWADFNQDGRWTPDEQIFDAQPVAAGVNALNFSVPEISVTNETTFTRWRFSNTHQHLEPTTIQDEPRGETPNGEVEDHPIVIRDGQPEHRFDFGDAPDSYRTTLANLGPFHRLEQGIHLGRRVDAEPDGQPSANALRDDAAGVDDEDGVSFLSAPVAGEIAEVEVIASVDGWLNAWVDFDQNGSWTPAEKIFDAQPLVAGINVLSFNVPATSVTNEITHSRWRFSTEAKSLPHHSDPSANRTVNGEVEDHTLRIQDPPQEQLDFGDAPNSYRTTLGVLGPSHRIEEGIYLGNGVDAEPDGQPSPDALRDDIAGFDDEDGVKFVTGPVAGGVAQVEVVASVDGWLNAWVDFDQDGTWTASEKIFDAQFLTSGSNILSFNVPATSVTNEITFSRWRFSTDAMSLPFHAPAAGAGSVNGEVEDHALRIQDPPREQLDFGDAPNSYRTTLGVSGPSHRIEEGIHLGNGVDAEPDGQPSLNAQRDDAAGFDDEDGVKFITPLVAGNVAQVDVVASVDGWLNAWVDFDQDGTWSPGEKIFDAQPLVAGSNILSFNVPATSVTNEVTYSRWRFSTDAMSLPFHNGGIGADEVNGEVEDHPLRIEDRPQEERLDYGDAPESYRTLLADNGARHQIDPNIFLGQSVDAEPDGQPSPGAQRDDLQTLDDEDGVRFLTPLIPGFDAKVEVTASEDGWLNAWVDFDRDGKFDPAGEAIATAEFIPIGTTVLSFVVPEIDDVDPHSLVYSRFRFSSDTKNLGPAGVRADGATPNGEVEDYAYLNGDLNGDLQRDIHDVHIMSQGIKNASTGRTDLNCDGTTDQTDMDLLIEEIFGTFKGDSDLDGDVDFTDFLNVSTNFGKSGADISWSDGDFDSNCEVGFSDFLLLSANFGKVSPAAVDAAFA